MQVDKWSKKSPYGLVLFGLTLTFTGYLSYSHTHVLRQHGIPARGVVVGYGVQIDDPHPDTDIPYARAEGFKTYVPRVRFQARSGEDVEFLLSRSNLQEHPLNTAVDLIYDPQQPSEVMLRTDVLGASGFVASLMPGGLLVLLGLSAFAVRIFRSKIRPLAKDRAYSRPNCRTT